MKVEETAENIIACWGNSDKTYAHLQTLIVRGIKHHRQSARAVSDLECETAENRIKELQEDNLELKKRLDQWEESMM